MYSVYIGNNKIDVHTFIRMINDLSLKSENEIWIFDNTSRYPCLSMMIADDRTAVHYFESEADVGSISYNKSFEGDTIFSFNDVCLSGQFIIDRNTAIKCVEQFVSNGKRPSCISWFDL